MFILNFYAFSFATRIENFTLYNTAHIKVYSFYSKERLKVFLYEEKQCTVIIITNYYYYKPLQLVNDVAYDVDSGFFNLF